MLTVMDHLLQAEFKAAQLDFHKKKKNQLCGNALQSVTCIICGCPGTVHNHLNLKSYIQS